MAIEIVMPQLGLTMTEGTVVKWLKKVGDPVKKGEPIFEVETDKVVQEVLSLDEGVLSQIVVGEGVSAPVGTPIAYLAAPGESVGSQAQGPGQQPQGVDVPSGTSTGVEPQPVVAAAGQPSVAFEVASAPVQASGGPAADFVRASPAAKKLAEKLGVDLKTLRGTGPTGRIVEEDVRRAATVVASAPTAAPAAAPAPAPVAAPIPASPRPPVPPSPRTGERVELRGVRKVVAERMAQSFSTAPHFYLTVEVEASALVAFRGQIVAAIQKRYSVEPTITDLLIRAAAIALREHPEANAAWVDGGIQRNPRVNLGVAAAIDEGLVVPVIPDADRLSVGEIALKRKDLVERARAGRLTLPDLEGGSFTLTNLGMFGIDQFQAIVNPPQAAILAVGRIKDRVVPVGGQVAVRPTMFMTLSVDHRVLDGAEGAKFLARIVELVEKPAEMLLAE